ncbi:glutathione S-transferase family protein [Paracraurococcus ruber]|uniref:Glutathione-dependent reductase n=1 Tax=Paracraurococcus ruber TaxID=77675 RepID=A0ABS1D4D1_9PROT|nr:glutathione S-transferase family protein [Paracraurococcus ruber]MBK1661326.1 glutathione-dependent reductase [Paracraurococcus ruber]TDG23082.1 glutathione S-transferase family protein [Paracraurococcus ruber]
MGRMVDGVWQVEEVGATGAGGRFQRTQTSFRDGIAPGGRFAPEAGRYHLYVSLACPWAHRTLIFRALKGLEDMISVSVTHWHMGDQGWNFAPGEGVVPDTVNGATAMHEIYAKADPHYSGRVTVPVLWDKATGSIVNNESAEIIRILNSAFDALGAAPGDWYPAPLRAEIEAVNERVYATLNNGVYRAGFARTQAAYEEAVVPLFETLDWLEARLSRQPFLCGEHATEADWRLFTTLIRFDAAYHGHFKCNLRRIVDYPALWDHTRSLHQHAGIAQTVDLGHIKRHYYGSHPAVNPTGVVPIGPALDLDRPGTRRVTPLG